MVELKKKIQHVSGFCIPCWNLAVTTKRTNFSKSLTAEAAIVHLQGNILVAVKYTMYMNL